MESPAVLAFNPGRDGALEEDAECWFDWSGPDPYMLYFRRVRDPDLIPAVTHVDGTARAQTVAVIEDRWYRRPSPDAPDVA